MGFVHDGPYEPMVGDPDDHRPATVWRLAVDPAGEVPMALLFERCAVGDRIPLHRHDVDEVVTVLNGEGEYTLGDDVRAVGAGDAVFIPAGVVHGTRNTGDRALHVHAVFPATKVQMQMVDRNPAPGTEADPPLTTVYDFATGTFETLGPTTSL